MENNKKELGNSLRKIDKFFELYPIVKEINNRNNGLIEKKIVFKSLKEDQYL